MLLLIVQPSQDNCFPLRTLNFLAVRVAENCPNDMIAHEAILVAQFLSTD